MSNPQVQPAKTNISWAGGARLPSVLMPGRAPSSTIPGAGAAAAAAAQAPGQASPISVTAAQTQVRVPPPIPPPFVRSSKSLPVPQQQQATQPSADSSEDMMVDAFSRLTSGGHGQRRHHQHQQLVLSTSFSPTPSGSVIRSPSWNSTASSPTSASGDASPSTLASPLAKSHSGLHQFRNRTLSDHKDGLRGQSPQSKAAKAGQPYDKSQRARKHLSVPTVLNPVKLADQANSEEHEPMTVFACSMVGCSRVFPDLFSLAEHLTQHVQTMQDIVAKNDCSYVAASTPSSLTDMLVDPRRKSL